MLNRTAAATTLCLGLLLLPSCAEQESACTQPAASTPIDAEASEGDVTDAASEHQFEWVELNERNVLDGTWAARRFWLNGQISMEDASGVIEFTLSPPELAALLAVVQHPSFVRFETGSALECPGSSHDTLFLRASTLRGTVLEQSGFANCLWSRRDNTNLGQLTYGVTEFLRLVGQISVSHLDCPHPTDLEDGILESAPPGLNKLCQSVWNNLSELELAECQDEAIAVGVEDCY